MREPLELPSPEIIAQFRLFHELSPSLPENRGLKSPLTAGFLGLVSGITKNREKNGGGESKKSQALATSLPALSIFPENREKYREFYFLGEQHNDRKHIVSKDALY
jgi:hypothetical protein